jgi:aryl-alcohol dehydrogenase-like predicted oxidoreductase
VRVSSDVTRLGHSSQIILRLAFGCEQLGGYQWGAVDPGEVAAAIELAIGQGVTLFDTADCYGRGESERRLGRVLAPHRERVILATKFGVRFSDSGSVWYDSSPQWAEKALDASLARLGTEAVDLLQMHYWDGVTPLQALFDRLERLRERQKIRWYGVTNHVPDNMVPGDYPGLVSASLECSLVERAHERAAQQITRAGLTFLAYGSLAQGMLSGKYRAGDRFGAGDRRSRPRYRNFHGERLARNSRIVEVLRSHARELSASPSQLAIAWVLHAIPESVALVGIKRAAQLSDALGALRLNLSGETLIALDEASAGAGTGVDAATP